MKKFTNVYLYPLFFGFSIVFFEKITDGHLSFGGALIIKSALFITALLVFEDSYKKFKSEK